MCVTATIVTLVTLVTLGACGEERSRSSDDDDDGGSGGAGGMSSTVSSAGTNSGGGTAGGPTTTTTGGGTGGGICGSDLTYQDDILDGCTDFNCCNTFSPCVANVDCANCLADGTVAGCNTNALFQSFISCRNAYCPTSVCNTGLGYGSLNLNACLNASSCCDEFATCEANTACSNCLGDATASGCSTNTLYNAYNGCREAECAQKICGAPIVYNDNYFNGASDVSYTKNKCVTQNCCAEFDACADPSSNGYPPDPSTPDPELEACLSCLANDPSCSPAVDPYANSFTICVTNDC